MRAVITVLGKDNVGILAKVSNVCADAGANIIEVTQSVLQEMFAMIMFVEIGDIKFKRCAEIVADALLFGTIGSIFQS